MAKKKKNSLQFSNAFALIILYFLLRTARARTRCFCNRIISNTAANIWFVLFVERNRRHDIITYFYFNNNNYFGITSVVDRSIRKSLLYPILVACAHDFSPTSIDILPTTRTGGFRRFWIAVFRLAEITTFREIVTGLLLFIRTKSAERSECVHDFDTQETRLCRV